MRTLPALCLALLCGAGAIGLYWAFSHQMGEPQSALRALARQGVSPDLAAAFSAVARDDQHTLHLLSRAGVSLHQPDAQGDTPLHAAVRSGRWDTAAFLLSRGSGVPQPDSEGTTLLQHALEGQQLAFARELLQRGASPDGAAPEGQPPLIEAIRRGHVPSIRLLLAHGANPNIRNAAGTQPLYLALRSHQPEVISLLLQAGAGPNATSPAGQPLLNFLCQHFQTCGYAEDEAIALLQQLLAAGANPESPDQEGKQPLRLALENGFTAAVNALLPRVSDVRDTLWIALDREDAQLAKTLLKKGADANQPRADGDRPLTFAVRHGRLDLIQAFLDHGADPALPGLEGQAVLPLALVLGDEGVVLGLLAHPRGPDPNRTLEHPVTPAFRDLVSDSLLSFYLANASQITPLMCAVCLEQEALVIRLLAAGASRHAGTAPQKVFPIQLAARKRNVRLQQILLGVPHEDNRQARLFVINLKDQEVTFYKDGAKVKTAPISSGRKSHPTETGTYVITDKARMHHSNIYDEAEMPFFQRFSCTAMGFHAGSLPGYPASHGCVRLGKETAGSFFEESKIGDRVIILESVVKGGS